MKPNRFRFATASVRGRILFGFGLITLIVLITVSAGYIQLAQVRDASTLITPNSLQIGRLQEFALSVASFEGNLDRYFVIGGAEYRESVQADLDRMVSLANTLHESAASQGKEATAKLAEDAAALQAEGLAVLDAESAGLSSSEINLQIIELYRHVDALKGFQQEMTARALAQLQNTADTQQNIISRVITQFTVLGIAALLLSTVAAYFVRRILAPIGTLTEVALDISSGNLDRVAPVQSNDELGTLARTFNSMTAQLRELIGGLEQRIESRTRALEASTEVGRRLATILDMRQLVSEVVNQVQSTFEYYHAHIYLLNEKTQRLEMAGGTGEAGMAMLSAGHSLRLDQGLVGRAATVKEPVLIPDVTQDANWLPNPLLPDTKAETAVPIIYGDDLLGVLDVQHNVIDGLSEEDVHLLQSIASQVAIALRNARLYEQAQRQANQQMVLNEISRQIQQSTSMEAVLKVAARELAQALGTQRAIIQIGRDEVAGNGRITR